MQAEVVVVGGGIGGLTVAALLAARGVDVCLVERESSVGGCAVGFEKFGYRFEHGYGLYTGWEPDQIHHRIFAELPVQPPAVERLEPSYAVRLPDHSEIGIASNNNAFEGDLKRVFPECAEAAVSFYRTMATVSAAYDRLAKKASDLAATVRGPQRFSFFRKDTDQETVWSASQRPAVDKLANVSFRFRRFVDVQLQTLCQAASSHTSYLFAAIALTNARGKMFGIQGGPLSLAAALADSLRQSGGKLRLDTSVLRLAYNPEGEAVGVDLLTGETLTASRAIISNLTIWDTYGKLVGLNRTPASIRMKLKSQRGWGAYLMYLGWDEANAKALKTDKLVALSDWREGVDFDPSQTQFFFNAAPEANPRAPAGKRAVTVHTFTDVDDWFTFHTDETELEAQDQQFLETCWEKLHAAFPELGDSVEVIDTATPQSFYQQTRRKLGMVGGLPVSSGAWPNQPTYLSSVPNLFIISDTTALAGIAGLSQSALALANHLTR